MSNSNLKSKHGALQELYLNVESNKNGELLKTSYYLRISDICWFETDIFWGGSLWFVWSCMSPPTTQITARLLANFQKVEFRVTQMLQK